MMQGNKLGAVWVRFIRAAATRIITIRAVATTRVKVHLEWILFDLRFNLWDRHEKGYIQAIFVGILN
jgi:hypothetical protein